MQTPRIVYSLLLAMLFATLFQAAWAESWLETDWSDGQWEALDSLDPDATPGELVLLADPLHFVPALASTGYDGIWDLAVWQNRLYLAAGGNPPLMTEIADILVYDYESREWTLDYSVEEEGIVVLEVHDGVLYSPGVDALRSPYWGNIYYNDGSGWTKKETIPFAVHVFGIFFHDGKIWVTTGQGAPNYRGSLFSSADMGDTWQEEFAIWSQPPESMFRRLYAGTAFGGSIFLQPDFLAPEGQVILELLPGGAVVEHEIAAYTEGIGAFIEFDGKLWWRMRYSLSVYDGESWTNIEVPFGSPNFPGRAITVFKERLYFGGQHHICATDDGSTWDYAQIDQYTDRVFETLEQFHGRLYAGATPYGEVYVTSVPESGWLESRPHHFASPVADGTVGWQGLLQGPTTSIEFQIRSAAVETDLPAAPFVGPDGSPTSWYENSGTALATMHAGDTWFQYRVRLASGDPSCAPVLEEFHLEVDHPTAVGNGSSTSVALTAYPNPFNTRTSLRYRLEAAATVDLAVFDIKSRRVATLQQGVVGGPHSINWNGCDDLGREVPGGVYFARLVIDGRVLTQRLALVR